MVDPTQGIPFVTQNLRVGETYINKDGMLFEYTPVSSEELPADGELITVLAKQMGRVLLIRDRSYITKSGPSVRPLEAEGMKLVAKYTSVPAPEVIYTRFNDGRGTIAMTIIPGTTLEKHWEGLDNDNDEIKQSICRQIWELLSQLRQIPQKSELKHLFQCAADGSHTRDPMFEDFQQPSRHLETDLQLRTRIYERYIHCGGSRYKDQLFDMLPRSSSSVFTHGDIAPRNIMVDERHHITGLVDWEYSGWYPDYWEYAQIMRPSCLSRDWQAWMDATAEQKWDLSGINAARRILF
ncbi:hypothetical protein FQN50_003550 [Emmonsiellopsis sp. PD_5]|nr:hypothetical protein FQN50_003550 [Emmonsiellopsis sp. PD_5]